MKHRSQHRKFYYVIAFILILCFYSLAIAHGWKVPKEVAQMINPVASNKASIQAGQELYTQFCNYCHGDTAEGGANLNLDIKPLPPDLKKRLKGHSEGSFFWKIKTGKKDMPAFEEDLEDEEVWRIIVFIKSLII